MRNFFKKFHSCEFNKPILSKYVSFNERDIIYECICGKRKARIVDITHNIPIETTNLISYQEFNEILNNKQTRNIMLNRFNELLEKRKNLTADYLEEQELINLSKNMTEDELAHIDKGLLELSNSSRLEKIGNMLDNLAEKMSKETERLKNTK